MQVTAADIPEVLLIEPVAHGDARGFFLETWREDRYREAGIAEAFRQDSVSRSCRGSIRGIHFQHPRAQAKLVGVLEGEIFDVVVDLRRTSPTFGQWMAAELSARNHRQLYIPRGFGHAFCVLSETALVSYKLSEYHHPEHEHTIRWDDPTIGISWPVNAPIVSPKDANGYLLATIPPESLFTP
ncbi:MAG: dTDP-4-dehydrorhamnose 3,5-epimerase [Deltaproteobacteria bacterium]|nr:dTDP-4-dehydrorhamnose 3,5-epimerase [Deltaproteobacteria bacterium]